MEWNDPKINWYLTKPSFYHSSNNNPILSEMDQRFLHQKKKNLTRSQRYLSKWHYSSCNDSILPTCKIKIIESHDSTQLFHHKEKTQRLLFQSYKIIPRGNDLDITLGNRIKTRHPTNSFPSKDSLNKNSVHSSTVLDSHKLSIYLRVVLFLPVATDSPDTGEQRKAKWRASAGSTRYRFHHVSPGHATLSAPFTDHHDAIFPPNPPPTCTRIYRANRKRSTWIHGFDSCPLSSA